MCPCLPEGQSPQLYNESPTSLEAFPSLGKLGGWFEGRGPLIHVAFSDSDLGNVQMMNPWFQEASGQQPPQEWSSPWPLASKPEPLAWWHRNITFAKEQNSTEDLMGISQWFMNRETSCLADRKELQKDEQNGRFYKHGTGTRKKCYLILLWGQKGSIKWMTSLVLTRKFQI